MLSIVSSINAARLYVGKMILTNGETFILNMYALNLFYLVLNVFLLSVTLRLRALVA